MPLADVWKVQWQQHPAPGSCDGSVASGREKDLLTFYLSSETADVLNWLGGLALTARVADDVGIEQVASIVKMFSSANVLWRDQYASSVGAPGEPVTGASIAARFTERPTPTEVAAVAAIVNAIVARRSGQNVPPISATERQILSALMPGCAEIGVHAVAAAGAAGDPLSVVEWAHGRGRAEKGRIPLLLLASAGSLPAAEIVRVLSTLGFEGSAADRKRALVYSREWLSSITDVMDLPPGLLHSIVDYANERQSAGDSAAARDASLVLARSFRSLPAADRPVVLELFPDPSSPRSVLPPSEPVVELAGVRASTGTALSAAIWNVTG